MSLCAPTPLNTIASPTASSSSPPPPTPRKSTPSHLPTQSRRRHSNPRRSPRIRRRPRPQLRYLSTQCGSPHLTSPSKACSSPQSLVTRISLRAPSDQRRAQPPARVQQALLRLSWPPPPIPPQSPSVFLFVSSPRLSSPLLLLLSLTKKTRPCAIDKHNVRQLHLLARRHGRRLWQRQRSIARENSNHPFARGGWLTESYLKLWLSLVRPPCLPFTQTLNSFVCLMEPKGASIEAAGFVQVS